MSRSVIKDIRALLEARERPAEAPSLDVLRASEWSPGFERLMRSRLVLGALRYGRIHAPGKPRYDRTKRMSELIEEYRKTKNKECLVDVANLALLEFEEGDGVWAPSDDGKHAEVRQ